MSENLSIRDSEKHPIQSVQSAQLFEGCRTGQRVEAVFRYGCCYECGSKIGEVAWQIDLFQRQAMVTGFALQADIGPIPPVDSLVRIEGTVIQADGEVQLWVRSLELLDTLGPECCIFDTALPHWIVDKIAVDRACALWATLPDEDRRFVNAVFLEPHILRGFLLAPGSCKHHHAHDGGCIQHSVETAEMASAIAARKSRLDRNLLVTMALIHDAGKALEYQRSRNGRWSMSRCGLQIGHKVSGIRLASLALSCCPNMSSERKESFLHLMSCSFAPAWVGLRVPLSQEAHVFSAIDRLSAEAGVQQAVGRF